MSEESNQAILFDLAPEAPQEQAGFEEKLMKTLISKFREVSKDLSSDEVEALVEIIKTKTDDPDDILEIFPRPEQEDEAREETEGEDDSSDEWTYGDE